MAKKLLWEKKGSIGNVKESYICSVNFRNEQCKIGEILVFKKGEYCLPQGMFPRTKKGILQRTKSLTAAKSKVQKWFNDFIAFNQ